MRRPLPHRPLLAGLASIAVVAGLLVPTATAQGAETEFGPPWCGTPTSDAAEELPDGSDPSDPPGSFPHIPYYAIECTLQEIQSRSDGRMSLEVVGQSALGRDMYGVTINALDTAPRRQAFQAWEQVRKVALSDPARGQALVAAAGDDIKTPVFLQGAIHGNEYEGVDADIQLIDRLATTPPGADPEVDAILDHLVVVFNVIQNPDGRVAGTRANGNGFDLNRDYLTQSQSETQASVRMLKKWLPPEVLDQHGYVTPTLIEATTKPHNPSIEYDLWLKWNQSRIDANEAALHDVGLDVTRPINDWCSNGNPAPPSGICPDGDPAGPAEAEGWDDWGPFYTAMYSQHVGLDASTVEMCRSESQCGGREGARLAQYVTAWSTMQYVIDNRSEMLHDELEIYRRGVVNAPRPECCPAPFDVDNNWMLEYPEAYVIPMGAGQRSVPEAARLVEWLLFNDIVVEQAKTDFTYDGRTFEQGSYVVPMEQARRGLADTALRIGVDISPRISILYAPPAAWSHGYLWGADVVTVDQGSSFAPTTNRITKPAAPGGGGVEPGNATAYALEVDSPTAVRTVNALVGSGVPAWLATEPFAGTGGDALAAGTVLFAADPATRNRLAATGRDAGLVFRRVSGALPQRDAIDRVPRIAVLTGSLNQDIWSLRDLGFPADPVSTQTINSAADDPLSGYDVVWNTGNWPSAALPTARTRLTAFFDGGGGYLGAGTGGANFLGASGQVTGLSVASRGGGGRSGIVYWDNVGGATSVVTGAYPDRDTAIMDPPTWFLSVPSTMSVDAELPETDYFAAGLWSPDAQSASAPGSPVVAHGTTTSGNARATVFAMNPLYRADPEREWPMVGTAALWADQ